MSSSARLDALKFFLLPQDDRKENNKHDVKLFANLKGGPDDTKRTPPNNLQPAVQQFVGRAIDMRHIIYQLMDNGVRLSILTGDHGIGKFATSLMVSRYFCDKRREQPKRNRQKNMEKTLRNKNNNNNNNKQNSNQKPKDSDIKINVTLHDSKDDSEHDVYVNARGNVTNNLKQKQKQHRSSNRTSNGHHNNQQNNHHHQNHHKNNNYKNSNSRHSKQHKKTKIDPLIKNVENHKDMVKVIGIEMNINVVQIIICQQCVVQYHILHLRYKRITI